MEIAAPERDDGPVDQTLAPTIGGGERGFGSVAESGSGRRDRVGQRGGISVTQRRATLRMASVPCEGWPPIQIAELMCLPLTRPAVARLRAFSLYGQAVGRRKRWPAFDAAPAHAHSLFGARPRILSAPATLHRPPYWAPSPDTYCWRSLEFSPQSSQGFFDYGAGILGGAVSRRSVVARLLCQSQLGAEIADALGLVSVAAQQPAQLIAQSRLDLPALGNPH